MVEDYYSAVVVVGGREGGCRSILLQGQQPRTTYSLHRAGRTPVLRLQVCPGDEKPVPPSLAPIASSVLVTPVVGLFLCSLLLAEDTVSIHGHVGVDLFVMPQNRRVVYKVNTFCSSGATLGFI